MKQARVQGSVPLSQRKLRVGLSRRESVIRGFYGNKGCLERSKTDSGGGAQQTESGIIRVYKLQMFPANLDQITTHKFNFHLRC